MHGHAGNQPAYGNRVIVVLLTLRPPPFEGYGLIGLDFDLRVSLGNKFATGDDALADRGVEIIDGLLMKLG